MLQASWRGRGSHTHTHAHTHTHTTLSHSLLRFLPGAGGVHQVIELVQGIQVHLREVLGGGEGGEEGREERRGRSRGEEGGEEGREERRDKVATQVVL